MIMTNTEDTDPKNCDQFEELGRAYSEAQQVAMLYARYEAQAECERVIARLGDILGALGDQREEILDLIKRFASFGLFGPEPEVFEMLRSRARAVSTSPGDDPTRGELREIAQKPPITRWFRGAKHENPALPRPQSRLPQHRPAEHQVHSRSEAGTCSSPTPLKR
jgi:hypothetical protein